MGAKVVGWCAIAVRTSVEAARVLVVLCEVVLGLWRDNAEGSEGARVAGDEVGTMGEGLRLRLGCSMTAARRDNGGGCGLETVAMDSPGSALHILQTRDGADDCTWRGVQLCSWVPWGTSSVL